MSSVRAKNTKLEVEIRRRLFSMGFRYRLHRKNLPGTPDVVFLKYRSVVFINGCFWHYHGCHLSSIPETRRSWWMAKLEETARRDAEAVSELRKLDWRGIGNLGMLAAKTENESYGSNGRHCRASGKLPEVRTERVGNSEVVPQHKSIGIGAVSLWHMRYLTIRPTLSAYLSACIPGYSPPWEADLVTNDVVAVIELVKNSYDAFARNVWLRFRGHDSQGKYLEIEDDGRGMTREIIENVWCLVATPHKELNSVVKSDAKERRVSGEKGLGRLSAARLGKRLNMLTQAPENSCWDVRVNWEEISKKNDLSGSFAECARYNQESPFEKSGTRLPDS